MPSPMGRNLAQLPQPLLYPHQVRDELRIFRFLVVLDAEQEAGVDGDPGLAAFRQGMGAAAGGGDGHRLAEKGAGGGGAQSDGQSGAEDRALLRDPPAAGGDLARIGLGMDAALAAALELE